MDNSIIYVLPPQPGSSIDLSHLSKDPYTYPFFSSSVDRGRSGNLGSFPPNLAADRIFNFTQRSSSSCARSRGVSVCENMGPHRLKQCEKSLKRAPRDVSRFGHENLLARDRRLRATCAHKSNIWSIFLPSYLSGKRGKSLQPYSQLFPPPLSKVFSIETGDGRGPFFARSRPSRRKVLLEEPCAFAITIIMLLLGFRITRTFFSPNLLWRFCKPHQRKSDFGVLLAYSA